MKRSAAPDLARALAVCSTDIATAVQASSRFLRDRGIRHALCDGIAVSAYAPARVTDTVHFAVGDEAFERQGELVFFRGPVRCAWVRVVCTALEGPLSALAPLLDVERMEGVPVLPAEALIAMKVVSRSLQDQADIFSLIESGAVDASACRGWLGERGFDVALFDALVEKAKVG